MCGMLQTDYTSSTLKIKDATWEKIIAGARQYSKVIHKPDNPSDLIIVDEDDANTDFDKDESDLE